MWKVCVVFSFFCGTARQPNRVFGNFWSLLSGWNLSIQKPPNVFSSPTSKSQRHVVFMWFPLSAAAATVCVSSGFLFCFHDDDFPACDSYVCLSSTFMTIYQGKIHLHLHFHFYSHCHFHFHCWRTWSTLCFYWLHENISHPPLFSFCFCFAAAIVNHTATEVMKYFFLFFFF